MRFILLFFISISAYALPPYDSIAVLDFELKDLTLIPAISAEIKRTASIKPLLEQALSKSGYQIITIHRHDQLDADSGVGYLFDHNDVAARLGEKYGADLIIVGRLHKPSFLFAYLMVHLIDVKTGQLIGDYVSEAKGTQQKITEKAVESLCVKIDQTLQKRLRLKRL